MTKESLFLLILVGAAAVGIIYVIQKASTNEDEWNEFRNVHLGDTHAAVRARFSAASDDMLSMSDARAAGYISDFKKAAEAGGVKMFVVPSRDDSFIFAFDKDNRLVYKNYRGDE